MKFIFSWISDVLHTVLMRFHLNRKFILWNPQQVYVSQSAAFYSETMKNQKKKSRKSLTYVIVLQII